MARDTKSISVAERAVSVWRVVPQPMAKIETRNINATTNIERLAFKSRLPQAMDGATISAPPGHVIYVRPEIQPAPMSVKADSLILAALGKLVKMRPGDLGAHNSQFRLARPEHDSRRDRVTVSFVKVRLFEANESRLVEFGMLKPPPFPR